MRIVDSLLPEIEREAQTTRKFLEAVPADKMAYKPHEKSMAMGALAIHVATLPGMMADWGTTDEFDMDMNQPAKAEPTRDAILAAFEKSLAHCKEELSKVDDQRMMATWKFKVQGKVVMEMPRIGLYRFFMLNHLYHHRGQLGVYLRLAGAKVPSSYGPSADENPLAELMAGAKA